MAYNNIPQELQEIVTGFTPINAPRHEIKVSSDPPPPRPWPGKGKGKRKRGGTTDAQGVSFDDTRSDMADQESIMYDVQQLAPKQARQVKRTPEAKKELQDRNFLSRESHDSLEDLDNAQFSTCGRPQKQELEIRIEAECYNIESTTASIDEHRSIHQPDLNSSSSTIYEICADQPSRDSQAIANHPSSDDDYGCIDDDDMDTLILNSEDTACHDQQIPLYSLQHECGQIPCNERYNPPRQLSTGLVDHNLDGSNGTATTLIGDETFLVVKHVSECLDIPHSAAKAAFKSPVVRKPFVRKKPPQSLRDRSPIIGISPTTSLRTCFRIGEVYKFGNAAIKEGKNVILEVYAKVAVSCRESNGIQQTFELHDIFHDKPPYISGHYDLWKGNDLWDYESGLFLEQSMDKRMCRCICVPKYDERKQLTLMILNV